MGIVTIEAFIRRVSAFSLVSSNHLDGRDSTTSEFATTRKNAALKGRGEVNHGDAEKRRKGIGPRIDTDETRKNTKIIHQVQVSPIHVDFFYLLVPEFFRVSSVSIRGPAITD
jgi:hypothetical protein